MELSVKPAIILTHESDLDGLLSGLLLQRLARELFSAEVRIEACQYQTWRQRDMRETSAWVADFAFDARLDRLGWVVVDHHPTEVKPQRAQFLHDTTKSAALLCYELCRERGIASPELERLVHLTNVGDLFLMDDPDFALASDYANLVKVYGFWNLHALINGRPESLLHHPLLEVMEVKRRLEDPLGVEWSRKNLVEVAPSIAFVNTVVGNTNLVVHRLLYEDATPFTVLISAFRRSNGQVIVSLRSRHGEAQRVAEKLQGGGHPNASGAILPRSVRSVNEGIDYLRQALNPALSGDTPLNNLESIFAELDRQKVAVPRK